MNKTVTIVGGGLAGSQAALRLANLGIKIKLYEMRPKHPTQVHVSGNFAEFVCSNSLGSSDELNASGELKKELKILNSELLDIAYKTSVPAGGALAVDRTLFSETVTKNIENHPNISIFREEITEFPNDDAVLISSGPLTSPSFSESLQVFTGQNHLFFFDAVAPIVEKESINFDKAFYANRYNKGDSCYINCPMNKEEYLKFYETLINSPKIELKSFEKDAKFFESCLPIEVLASRGIDTLRFGPMKPVGLIDNRTGHENYAVVQLRQDNKADTLYNIVGFQTNLKWNAQKELLQSIPGLENVSIVRYGVMHRNTFINSPEILYPTLQSKKTKNVFFAGQITGTEGYTEAVMSGLVAAINIHRFLTGKDMIVFPEETMIGAILAYITTPKKSFQPINSNWGIVSSLPFDRKTYRDKKLKFKLLGERAASSSIWSII